MDVVTWDELFNYIQALKQQLAQRDQQVKHLTEQLTKKDESNKEEKK